EVARQPAPALDVDDHRFDGVATSRRYDAVELANRAGTEHAIGRAALALLERLDRLDQIVVVAKARFIAGDVESLAQEGHARIFGSRPDQRTVRNVHDLLFLLRRAAQFGELGLELLVALLRQGQLLQRPPRVVATPP